jgi:mannosyltransferase
VPAPPNARGRRWALLSLPTLASVVLGIWGLDSVALWNDEIFTARAIGNGLTGIYWQLWEAPLVPYYLLEWLWTGGGAIGGDFWLRASSVLCMAIAVALTTRIGLLLGGTRVALAAGLLLVATPSVDRYAQEARGYALATALVALATALLVQLAERAPSRLLWVSYSACLLAMGVVAPYALVVVPSHLVLLVSDRRWRPTLRGWWKSLLPLVLVVAVGAVAVARFSGLHEWAPPPSATQLPASLLWVFQGDWGGVRAALFGAVLVVLAVVSRTGIRWVAGAVTGVVSVFLVSLGPMSWWIPRTVVPLSVLMAVGAALAFARMRGWLMAGILVAIAILVVPAFAESRQPGARGLDVHAAVRVIDANGRPGDVVNTAVNDLLSWGVQRYSNRPGDFTYAPDASGRAWVLDDGVVCSRVGEWSVPPDGTLVLCSPLPAGWEDARTTGG